MYISGCIRCGEISGGILRSTGKRQKVIYKCVFDLVSIYMMEK
jgi:hypothetical protein